MTEIDPEYPQGSRVIPCLTRDHDILFQREIIRDMKLESEGKLGVARRDAATGKVLTRSEFFDIHAMTLLVVADVEARAKV